MSRLGQYDLGLFLERLTARSVLSQEEKLAILGLPAQAVRLRARQDFVHINEEISYSCFVASGLVARIGQTATGARQITAFHIPGDVPDLNSAVRPIGVGGLTALCDSTILRIPHTSIRELTSRYPAIAEAFWRDTLLDAAILMQWVINVGRRDARARLAHILCEMSIRYGGDRQILLHYDFRSRSDGAATMPRGLPIRAATICASACLTQLKAISSARCAVVWTVCHEALGVLYRRSTEVELKSLTRRHFAGNRSQNSGIAH